MHIPLDYYRILGLPIQATGEQLQQAHRDRSLQLPRREFSAVAIAGRKQLIDEAYQVLSNRDRRRQYDSQFLANAYSVDTPAAPAPSRTDLGVSPDLGEATLRSLATEPSAGDVPSTAINIEADQFSGALLLLLELGEYEQVIQLGRPYLSSGTRSLDDGHLGDPAMVQADVVLSLTLACLELGREQWQQRQYETAATSLETGHELLVKENQFATLRAEIQAELYKLRPYRILELLARPLDQTRERRQGLKLLKSMLEDRGGIEGTEDDLSGLAIDDFLRFIQQLRDYLTASEQQELFEQEARRPSPVATYLTVYALLARGFARHQPALVKRAKQLLGHLSQQQDVHLEQAVCAMLLGQTEEANRALEFSQEYEPLAYIREHSRNSPDLLPGLCLYTERWLKDELFPHFRDFKDQDATLRDYFADPQVQAFLESMIATPDPEWPSGPAPSRIPIVEGSLPIGAPSLVNPTAMGKPSRDRHPQPSPPAEPPSAPAKASRNGHGTAPQFEEVATDNRLAPRKTTSAVTTAAPVDTTLSMAERVASLSPEGRLSSAEASAAAAETAPRRVAKPTKDLKKKAKSPVAKADTTVSGPAAATNLASVGPAGAAAPSGKAGSVRWGRVAIVGTAGLLGLGLLGFATMRTASWVTAAISGPRLDGRPLNISLAEPAIDIPAAPSPEEQIGVNSIAQQVVEDWLAAKRAALGQDYQADALGEVLTGELLTQWQQRAEAAPRENWYWEYEHEVTIESVTPDDPTADQLQVTAVVNETARLFEYGVENTAASYDQNLTMRYDLVRRDGQWFVQNMGRAN